MTFRSPVTPLNHARSDLVILKVQSRAELKKMQLDVDIEPTLRFPGMTSVEKQIDQSESKVL